MSSRSSNSETEGARESLEFGAKKKQCWSSFCENGEGNDQIPLGNQVYNFNFFN